MIRSLLIILLAASSALAADRDLELAEEQAFKQAVALAEPSIVKVETVGGVDLVGNVLTGTGATTGVAVSEDGLIITSSFNFVSNPSAVLVTLPDGRPFPAEIVATDQARMLTLLRIDLSGDSTRLTPLAPAPREELRVGQWAIALGRTYDSPLPNLSVGILSALNRVWGRAVQTDAKVSPVNYGGPLIDISARGIGILVPLSPEKTGETAGVEWYDGGIGFAIPLEDVYNSLERLSQGDVLKPGLAGIGFEDQSILAGEPRVTRVRPASPADKAGIRIDDVITAADGQPTPRVPHLRHILGRKYAGDTLALTIRRGDQTLEVPLTLVPELQPWEAGALGVLPERPAEDDAPAGVGIRDVVPGSAADKAGLKRRDRITSIDGETGLDIQKLRQQLRDRQPGDTVKLEFTRDGTARTTEVVLQAVEETVPAQLAAATVPAPEDPDSVTVPVGRSTRSLPGGTDRNYWIYVPSQYNPRYEYSLLVWLHPAGDTMEAAMMRLWQAECDRRGIILAAPKAADLSGWTAGEAEMVHDLIVELSNRYHIDPQRICLHGYADGGQFAWACAFKFRELVRGVSVASAALRDRPADNDPETPLLISLIAGENDPLRPGLEQVAAILRDMKFPVHFSQPDQDDGYPDADTIGELARWIDMLDRL